MNLDQLSGTFEKYAGKTRDRARLGIAKLTDLLTVNVLEGMIIPKKCLCAAIERGTISIACGTRLFMKPSLKGIRRFDCESDRYPTPEETVRAIEEAIGIFGARGAVIVLSVPRPWLIVRSAEFPAVVKENLASVIAYELDRLTPLSPAEAMYDFSLSKEENDRITVLVIAMRTQTLRPYTDALEMKRLAARRITAGITGFSTICRVLGDGGQTTACLNIRDEGYDGCTIRNKLLGSLVSREFTGNEDENIRLVKDGIAPMLTGLENEEAPPVVLINTIPRYEKIQNELGFPARAITKDELKEKFGSDVSDELMGPLGGLVEELWPGHKGLDLAGKGLEATKKSPVTRVTAVLLGLIVIAMALYLVVPLFMERARLDRIEKEIAARRNEVKTIEALRQESSAIDADNAAIRNFKESAPMTLDIMKELTNILPKNVWLTRLRITGETVETEGYAASATEVLPRLEQSPLFRKVEFSSPTIRDTRLNADRFVIKMELEGFEKAAGPGAKREKK